MTGPAGAGRNGNGNADKTTTLMGPSWDSTITEADCADTANANRKSKELNAFIVLFFLPDSALRVGLTSAGCFHSYIGTQAYIPSRGIFE